MRLWPVKSVIVVGLFVYLLQLIVCEGGLQGS